MSKSGANSSPPIHGGTVRPAHQDRSTLAQPVFSRKPVADPASRAAHVVRPSQSRSTSYGYLAREMCSAADARHDRLKSRLHLSPSYFGTAGGAKVFFNKETTTCLVKPDGRILFNGELLTEKHPQAQDIFPALDKIALRIHDYHHGFVHDKFAGLVVKPAWDPASNHQEHYVS